MAQQHPGKPNLKEIAKQTVSEFVKNVNISPTIQDSLNVIFINFFNNMDKNRMSGERPNINKMKNAEGNRDLKVKSFLTDEQFKAYQKFMEE